MMPFTSHTVTQACYRTVVLLWPALLLLASPCSTRPSDHDLPEPKHRGHFTPQHHSGDIASRVASWSPLETQNVWELSGLPEGDIMEEEHPANTPAGGRNVARDPEVLWKDATIPYILDPTFTDSERKIIREGMDMLEEGTCLKLRPFALGDMDFVLIQGAPTGCWSYVGRRGGGQVLNLQHKGCVHKGVVAHEFLHAAGFFHQQSAHDRDTYVFVNYTNIQEGREGNFNKYNESEVTDFEIGYDYSSIMHYSRSAFSKNGHDTIVPLEEGAVIGLREKPSEKDLAKLSTKYACKDLEAGPEKQHNLMNSIRDGLSLLL